MSRKAITIEERLTEHLMVADRPEVEKLLNLCATALRFRFSIASPSPQKRQRKPKPEPQAKLAGVE